MSHVDDVSRLFLLVLLSSQYLSQLWNAIRGAPSKYFRNDPAKKALSDIVLKWDKTITAAVSEDDMRWKLTIHVFGWRRLKSIRRLCESLLRASYLGYQVPLYFHIDGEGLTGVADYVNKFEWPHGPKRVSVRDKRLGMPKSILSGWIPALDDEFAILLEDDVEVSEAFFEYALYCMSMMTHKRMIEGEDHGLIGCSMYTPRVNEIGPAVNAWSPPAWNPSKVLGHRFKLFYFQLPCSWGAIYNGKYWREFLQYYAIRENIANFPDPPNSRSNEWFSSWKRILIELMLFKGWYMLYPNFPKQASLSTNYFEKGIHSVFEGRTPHIPDELRRRGDSRFTVPLLRDFSALRTGLPVLSAGILSEISYVNLYHNLVEKRADLFIDVSPFLEAAKVPELYHYFSRPFEQKVA